MNSRRRFLKTGLTGLAGVTLLPPVDSFAGPAGSVAPSAAGKFKLRFALASDGHYGQPGIDSDGFYNDLVKWLTREHRDNHLDLVIINGDLVHDRPDLLPKVKSTFLDKLPVPYHTLPGNHDFADAALWKRVFGYEDNYMFEFGDIGFVLANTANTRGEYVCPNPVFLKEAFEKMKSKKIVFTVLHIAPHRWTPEEESIFLECPEVLEILHAYPNIKAVFHGHDHSLDGVRYTNKLPHLFDSHFGGNWGTDYKGYRIVEVTAENQVVTYQVNASMNPRLNSTRL
ncbi:metallophosphoesterase family protein [Hufsiella ginkgonis]|uniref:Metallophosphoesterase n=1 Tax=Hufsiella ginkgonis TaxID=2695274 RepID=A0A7K1Y025_9SPHI|nr:metallophosphoesterase [Hufsiella ginkgonis]MXV16349.1 metallophosphoesterase [Hufsiella ginkgonis]